MKNVAQTIFKKIELFNNLQALNVTVLQMKGLLYDIKWEKRHKSEYTLKKINFSKSLLGINEI